MIYLDNAATTRYKPKCVLKSLYKYTKKSANAGRGAYKASLDVATAIEKVRECLSKDLGGKKVIFTKNCTEALNLAIFGLHLKGEVLVSPYEHNAVLRPLRKLENLKEIRIRFIDCGGEKITASTIKNSISEHTKALFCTHVSNVTGLVNDVEDIANYTRNKGILFVCDMAQSMGHIMVDTSNIDILAASGHKGLHAPQGTGFLAYDQYRVQLSPLIYGGTGTSTLDLSQPHTYPEGYESGTLNSAGIIALGQGYLWTKKNFERINNRLEGLTRYLIKELERIAGIVIISPKNSCCGVVTFNVKGMPSTTVATMLDDEYNIAVRAGLHCAPYSHKAIGTIESGAVRISLGYKNSRQDIDRLIVALQEIYREKLSASFIK